VDWLANKWLRTLLSGFPLSTKRTRSSSQGKPHLEGGVADLKKDDEDRCKPKAVRYSFLHAEKTNHPITLLCKAFNVSESGIYHSDRGSQYCSRDYLKLFEKHGFEASMSGKGNCYPLQ